MTGWLQTMQFIQVFCLHIAVKSEQTGLLSWKKQKCLRQQGEPTGSKGPLQLVVGQKTARPPRGHHLLKEWH